MPPKMKVEDSDDSSSDFDEDDDPDSIRVPGGGKDLATSAALNHDPKVSGNNLVGVGTTIKKEGGNFMPFTKASALPGFQSARLIMKKENPGYEVLNVGGQVALNKLHQMMAMGYGPHLLGSNPQYQWVKVGMNSDAFPPKQQMMVQNKMINQIWMGGENSMVLNPQEEEENDDEDMGVAETYVDYMPSKLKLGRKHPDPVVETASLSSVEPTDVWYDVSLPSDTIRSGALSALQLEAITYACQQHEHFLPDGTRAGFLIGDGAGVGKGRTIAGLIFENFLKGRKKAIWVSVSNDLKYDSERDLRDIGATNINVLSLSKLKYAKISSSINGHVKKGVIFSTYSALIGESTQSSGKYKSRLKQLVQWCGEDFDGVIVFDECHRAKNLCPVGSTKPTKTGLTVLEIQNRLPKARVIYASATGASEPKNMAYMTRLGMWGKGTPFSAFNDFISAIEKRGVGAMEIIAMDVKLRGMYIARQLSFHGVTFRIEEVPLSKEFTQMYDDAVKLWVEALKRFQEAVELLDADNKMRKTMWGQFWSSHQRFFKYLCIASKVRCAVSIAREAVKCGKCVVIGLQSTGEARTLDQLERDDGELNDFVSTAKGVFQSLVEKHFPAPNRSKVFQLMGLDLPRDDLAEIESEAGSSSGKRKLGKQAITNTLNKKIKTTSSDSGSDKESTSGEEFKLISDSSGSDDEHSVNSNASDDFNPFDSDGDDPWLSRKKKTTVKKKNGSKNKTAPRKIPPPPLPEIKPKPVINNGNGNLMMSSAPGKEAVNETCMMKQELLSKIELLGGRLPPNTLDQLIDELGGPENVAEMTGRKGRVVQTDMGIHYESRSEADVPLETLNLTEKQRFMDGVKDVAIISEAASSGISLQSDRRAKNQRRRVHITLELPWSADRAIQQFGRTHRSNQVNAPEYIFMISDLAGERRFASIVAKRLESLGALTHGDRRATETRDLSKFNIDNKYGRAALEATMRAIMGYEPPLVSPPSDYKGDFMKDISKALIGVGLITCSENNPNSLMLDKDYNNMTKFLNRILGMPVDLQNRLFKYFTDTLQAIITQAKKTGRFDLGILDLGTAGENVKRVKVVKFWRKHVTGVATTELLTVQVERGMTWQDAVDLLAQQCDKHSGFYLSHQVRNSKHTAILAICTDTIYKSHSSQKEKSKKDMLFSVYRPNTGLQFRQETLKELEKKYTKETLDAVESSWKEQYEASSQICSHAYWRGNCKNVTLKMDCEVGLRKRTYYILSGSVLSIWTRIESVFASTAGHNAKMQVVRLRTTGGIKIVGSLIPKNCVEALQSALSTDAEKVKEETFDD